MKNVILLTALFFCGLNSGYSQAGEPDSSFGNNGLATSALGSVTCTAIQSTGKILLAGATGISRYNVDGSIDNTFGNNGTVPNNFEIVSMAIQSNDKFVIAGSVAGDFAVSRYNSDGSPDNTFSGDGKQTTDFENDDFPISVAIQDDGKVVLSGRTGYNMDQVLLRYNTNGSLDSSFDGDGKLKTLAILPYEGTKLLVIQADGKIVIAGDKSNDVVILRFNTDGSLDNTFDADGLKTIDFGYDEYPRSLVVQMDGKIVVTGELVMYPSEKIITYVARLNTDGSLDNSFSDDGKLISDFGMNLVVSFSVAVQDDDKILIGGVAEDATGTHFIIARYFSNGNLDNSFSGDGIILTQANNYAHINDLVISNNKIYAIQYPLGIARYSLGGKSIAISSPVNNSAFNAPASIDITASVTNTDAAITKVEFYNGTTLLYTDNTSPYSYNWTNVPTGNYILTAKEIDNTGSSITSQEVHVSVVQSQAPSISFQSPLDNSSYQGPANIALKALADDAHPGGAVSKVEFYNGTELLARVNTSPYSFNWTNVLPGSYTLTAKATDNTGLTASAIVHVSVNIAKPTFGFNFNGTPVANINNGTPDPGESASITVCGAGPYTTSEHFHSSLSNLYNITVTPSGGILFFDGDNQAGNGILTAAQLTSTAGAHTVKLANADIGGTLIQTITPFQDLNNDKKLDAGDVAGDPIVFTYSATPKPTWYKDADGDQHASETRRSCTSPGQGWTLNPLPVDDCNDNDPSPCGPNLPPTVNITSPANGATFLQPFPVTLSANASDPDGTIKSVDFYSGSTLLFTEYEFPYSRAWGALTGDHSITAVATDNLGLKTTSAPVLIHVIPDQPSVVNILSPLNGTSYLAPATIIIKADAYDVDSKIKKVDFYSGTTLLGTDKYYGYGLHWKDVPPGNYTITARVTDIFGRVIISAPVNISVVPDTPPAVNITSPVSGAGYTAPASILIRANANASNGTITKVEFYNGATLLGTDHYNGYGWHWNNVPPGTYTITAKATNNWGAVTTSTPITVTVTSPGALPVSSRPPSAKNKADINGAVSLKLAPNPVNNILNIYTKGSEKDKQTTISVISASGTVMRTMRSTCSTQTIQLNVSSLASGVYTIKILSEDKVVYKQFVKL